MLSISEAVSTFHAFAIVPSYISFTFKRGESLPEHVEQGTGEIKQAIKFFKAASIYRTQFPMPVLSSHFSFLSTRTRAGELHKFKFCTEKLNTVEPR